MKKFRITIDSEHEFDISELWPDGDAPESPTAADVRQLVKDSGGVRAIVRDWDLTLDMFVCEVPA